MEDLFYDRLAGKTYPCPETHQTIMGRWLVLPPGSVSFFMNSVPVNTGEFLVPELPGNWRVLSENGILAQGTMVKSLQPEDIEADCIRAIGTHLAAICEDSGSWINWLDVVPLVPGMSEKANQLPFERMIGEDFGHLEAVCMKPRTHLHVEVERVQVDKARRLPAEAASFLASHTEDWERPLIHGVLPKRILSEVRQDQLDIYENRVVARLVDQILLHLEKRIQELRKLLKMFQEKEDYTSAVGGTYLRRQRILRLWGQSIDSNEGRRRARATLKELEGLKYRVRGLIDSLLYREIPRRAYVAPTLHTTNILANDQNYRRVADLWRAWASIGYIETKSPADIHKEGQELYRGMDRFAVLLVLRALDQLGYEPIDKDLEKPVQASVQWELHGHGSRINLIWAKDGKIRLETGGKSLAFVALPVDFTAASNDDLVNTMLNRVVEAAGDDDGKLIVLHAGSPNGLRLKISEDAHYRLCTIGNDPRTRLPTNIGFLSISPWDIGSVDRIARALRWFLDSARFDSYPSIIKIEIDAHNLWDYSITEDWLMVSNHGNMLTMLRLPKSFEWEQLPIDRLVNEAEEMHQQTVANHERLSSELREAVRERKTGTLTQQKQNAKIQRTESEKRLAAINQLHQDLADARDRSEALLICPACGVKADPMNAFKPRDKGCFRCDCQECNTHWETRLCSNGHRYAAMLPGSDFIYTEDTSPGWEDRVYGSDLLALPSRKTNGGWGFVCPTCGEIT